jgi:hypothetical protein
VAKSSSPRRDTHAPRIAAARAAAESDEPLEAPTPLAWTFGCGGSWRQALACIVGRVEQEGQDDEKLVDQAVEEMGSDVEEMQERSEELGDRVDETRSDWRSKQKDNAVPGAQPPPDDEAEHPPSKRN